MPQTPRSSDGDLRRRAAWLLGMLVIVAILLVIIMSTVLHGGSGGGSDNTALDPNHITATAPPSGSPGSSSSSGATGPTGAGSTVTSGTPSDVPTGAASCPTSAPCALTTDVGNAVAAVNAYRAEHGKSTVPGSVTTPAAQCALNRGNGCSGGWAETELSTPDGTLAVTKISQFAKLLDPMSAIQVGWAYDPGSKTYYFSTIRTS